MKAERSRENRTWLKWYAGMLALGALGCGSEAAAGSDAAPSVMAPAAPAMMAATSAASGNAAAASGTGKTSATPAMTPTSNAAAAAPSSTPAAGGGGAGNAAATTSKTQSKASEAAPTAAGAPAAQSGGTGAATAGAAGSATTPTAGSAAAGAGAPAMHEDLGKGDGHDVVLIGDSWMSNTLQVEGTGGGLAPSLQMAAAQPYRNYGVQGVMLLSADAFGPAIPSQWDTAKAVNPDIKTVVMTGGGNDVIQNPGLQSDCRMNGDQCKMFRMQLLDALDKLWTQMAADGVKDVIYVRYSSNAGGGNSGSSADAGTMQPEQNMTVPVCLTDKISCHALDTNDLVMNDLAADNIHPLVTANGRMAKAIVDMMEKAGMRR